MGTALAELRDKFPCRTAAFELVEGDTRTLLAGYGLEERADSPRVLPQVSSDPLITTIVVARKPTIASKPPRASQRSVDPAAVNVNAWIGVPVVYEDKVIGILSLGHDQPGFFTEDIKNRLVSFAASIAPRIAYACVRDSAQRLSRDIEVINEVLLVTNSRYGGADLPSAIAAQIQQRLECSACTIFFPQAEGGDTRLVPIATHGERIEVMTRRFGVGEGLVGWVFSHGKSLLIADTESDPRFSPARDSRALARSMLVVPVKVGEQTIGAISLDQNALGWFSDDDRRFVETLGRQLGIAIQQSIGLALLQEIGSSIAGSRTVDDILRLVIAGAVRLTNMSSGVIYLLSEDGHSVLNAYKMPGFSYPPPRLDGSGFTRRLMRTGELISIPDITTHPLVNPALHSAFRSMIAVPLKAGAKVIGVLYLNDVNRHDFTESEASFLWTLATQATIAVQNARLIESHLGHLADRTFAEEMPCRVFINYAKEDLPLAQRLARDLERHGISSWVDVSRLSPGQAWKKEIRRAIRESEFVIILLSSRSVSKRGYVNVEIREGLAALREMPEGRVFLIPVRVDACEPAFDELRELQWVDLFPVYEEGVQQLLRAILRERRTDQCQPA